MSVYKKMRSIQNTSLLINCVLVNLAKEKPKNIDIHGQWLNPISKDWSIYILCIPSTPGCNVNFRAQWPGCPLSRVLKSSLLARWRLNNPILYTYYGVLSECCERFTILTSVALLHWAWWEWVHYITARSFLWLLCEHCDKMHALVVLCPRPVIKFVIFCSSHALRSKSAAPDFMSGNVHQYIANTITAMKNI